MLTEHGIEEVSIPLWFDWKLLKYFAKFPDKEFQFHFGSIGSR